jgi:hypothetical protein
MVIAEGRAVGMADQHCRIRFTRGCGMPTGGSGLKPEFATFSASTWAPMSDNSL